MVRSVSNTTATSTVTDPAPPELQKVPEGSAAVDQRPLALSVRGMSKAFGPNQALWPLDLDIREGEIHAVLGENGSGKSTLIKCLSGYHRPETGQVWIAGKVLDLGNPRSSHDLGCRFVHQDLGLIRSESILDNLNIGGAYATRFGTINGRASRRAAKSDLARVGIDLNPRFSVAGLSPAEQTAVAVARALRPVEGVEARLLVLDEPTARLPHKEVDQLLEIVRSVARAGVAVIYVSHRIDEVLTVAETATVLRDGRKVATAAVMNLDRRKLVNLLVGDALAEVNVDNQRSPDDDAPVRLAVDRLTTQDLEDVSLEVRQGEIVGIAGITGSGRESILSTIFGGLPRPIGTVRIDGQILKPQRADLAITAGVAYLPPDRKVTASIMGASARENLMMADVSKHWRWPRISRKGERKEAKAWFDRLHVRPGDNVELRFSSFSGGNQQKVLFGKWLRVEPLVMLLDEPTQGVDIATKAELHKEIFAAAENGASVVVSSSDTEELLSVCHRILVMRHGRIVGMLNGKDKTVAKLTHASFGTSVAEAATS
jgi:ribose transport system ATP-binding protein